MLVGLERRVPLRLIGAGGHRRRTEARVDHLTVAIVLGRCLRGQKALRKLVQERRISTDRDVDRLRQLHVSRNTGLLFRYGSRRGNLRLFQLAALRIGSIFQTLGDELRRNCSSHRCQTVLGLFLLNSSFTSNRILVHFAFGRRKLLGGNAVMRGAVGMGGDIRGDALVALRSLLFRNRRLSLREVRRGSPPEHSGQILHYRRQTLYQVVGIRRGRHSQQQGAAQNPTQLQRTNHRQPTIAFVNTGDTSNSSLFLSRIVATTRTEQRG